MTEQKLTFTLRDEYIELISLLKLLRIASSGGIAKLIVEDGDVKCNGEVEYRKRYKVRAGDSIVVFGKTIEVIG